MELWTCPTTGARHGNSSQICSRRFATCRVGHHDAIRSRNIRRRLECADHIVERRLQQRRVSLDRHQQRPGRLAQRGCHGLRPRSGGRRHPRDPCKRHEASSRLRRSHGHVGIGHMARGPLLRHLDCAADVKRQELSRPSRNIPRLSHVPSRSRSYRRALPAWRCGSWRWSARRHASASRRAESRRHHRGEFP
ncbi:hypothetical protein V1278_004545 [Bradyrhizobium sp. AZCC 1577]